MLKMTKFRLAVIVTFLHFFVFIIFSNYFNWDEFFSSFEVELKSWLADLEPPLWSYQLCGGMTRIGDPQSFGVSPLFLLNIILGTFWGLKCQIFMAALVGHYFMRKILFLVLPNQDRDITDVLSLSFILSNFFLWHMHHGHITFVLMYYALGYFYLQLKILYGQETAKDRFQGFLCLFLILTAGFYQASLYFIFPFMLTVVIFIVWHFMVEKHQRRFWGICAGKMGLWTLLAVVAASYRLIPAIRYHLNYPRALHVLDETQGILDLLKHYFLPSIGYTFSGLSPASGTPWGIWEKSLFSLNIWLCLGAFIYIVSKHKFKKFLFQHSYSWPFFLILAFLGILLVTGDWASWSLTGIINKYILHSSMRVIDRFGVVLLFSITILTGLLLFSDPNISRFTGRRVKWIVIILLNLNFYSFYYPGYYFFSKMKLYRTSQAVESNSDMQLWLYTINDGRSGYTYQSVKLSLGVWNCNTGLPVPRKFLGKPARVLDLFSDSALPAECIEKSYFSQQQIFIDKSCPQEVCINITHHNIYRPTEFVYNPAKDRYCRPGNSEKL
jgi:hypothetical protein